MLLGLQTKQINIIEWVNNNPFCFRKKNNNKKQNALALAEYMQLQTEHAYPF